MEIVCVCVCVWFIYLNFIYQNNILIKVNNSVMLVTFSFKISYLFMKYYNCFITHTNTQTQWGWIWSRGWLKQALSVCVCVCVVPPVHASRHCTRSYETCMELTRVGWLALGFVWIVTLFQDVELKSRNLYIWS